MYKIRVISKITDTIPHNNSTTITQAEKSKIIRSASKQRVWYHSIKNKLSNKSMDNAKYITNKCECMHYFQFRFRSSGKGLGGSARRRATDS